jgi:hypothetical protein
MSRTKRIYNRKVVNYGHVFHPYVQYCMGNCHEHKRLKWKEMNRLKQYKNEYYTEQIREIV